MKYYRIINKDTGLGDFGDILLTGIISKNNNNELGILRTGRNVPPICIVGAMYLIINDKFKAALENEHFSGYEIEKITKSKIIDIDWISWIGRNEPEFYPKSGEPEDYFIEENHSNDLDKKVGEFWIMNLKSNGKVDEDKFHYDADFDFCEPKNRYSKFVSEDVKNWIEGNNFNEWIVFETIHCIPSSA